MTHFQALYGRPSPTVPIYHVGSSTMHEVDKALMSHDELLFQLKRNLETAVSQMKQAADKSRYEVEF